MVGRPFEHVLRTRVRYQFVEYSTANESIYDSQTERLSPHSHLRCWMAKLAWQNHLNEMTLCPGQQRLCMEVKC